MIRNVTVTLLLLLTLALFATPAQAQRIIANPSVYEPFGYTVSDKVTVAGVAAAVAISATKAMVYGMTVDSGATTAATDAYINVYNVAAASVVPGTTVPVFSWLVRGASSPVAIFPLGGNLGLPFSTALSFNCTTTKNGAVGLGVACHVVTVTK